MRSVISLVFYVGALHIWGPNCLHLIGPLRYSLSCSHLQTLTHSRGSRRANQCKAPKAICISSFHLSILYPQIHPSLAASSVPLLESGAPIPGTENQDSQKPHKHTDTHTHLLLSLFYNLNQRAKWFVCFVVVVLGFLLQYLYCSISVCMCVCSWVVSHPEQPLCCSENKACLKLS